MHYIEYHQTIRKPIPVLVQYSPQRHTMYNIPFDPDDEGPLPLRDSDRLTYLRALEQKILWLSTWIIHHANHIRPNDGQLKVGGHQASCASMVTLMTALYFSVLRPEDRVAV